MNRINQNIISSIIFDEREFEAKGFFHISISDISEGTSANWQLGLEGPSSLKNFKSVQISSKLSFNEMPKQFSSTSGSTDRDIEFISEQLLLFGDLFYLRNPNNQNKIQQLFPFESLYNFILNDHLNINIKAGLVRILNNVYIDVDPHQHFKLLRIKEEKSEKFFGAQSSIKCNFTSE